jgi:uncharacterized membrane protein SpoIIM required for sporulation
MSGISTVRQSLSSFRQEREVDWLAFEKLLDRLERGSPKKLSEDELIALPLLYRATLSSLSVARATSLDAGLIAYLEALALRGYLAMYGVRQGLGARAIGFLVRDWPRAMAGLWRETLVSLLLLVVGTIAGYRLVAADPGWFDAIMPAGMAGGRGPAASAAALRHVLYDNNNNQFLSGFAAYLFTHNAQIAILAFALGFAFAVPTVLLLLMNGVMLGAMLEIYVAKGLGWQLGGWLSIHGTTELFAITLAGAAGMRIGTRVAFPGRETRMAAAARAGRVAATAMMGVVVMLLCAGLLEGIGRQTITSDAVRYAIGGLMLLLWTGYYYLYPAVTRAKD